MITELLKDNKRLGILISSLVIAFLLSLSNSPKGLEEGELRFTMFDVGQGDSLFIETSEGVQVVIDGGPGDTVLHKLGAVMPYGDRTIDLLVLTHPHADHVTGLISILDRYEVSTVVYGSVAYDSAVYDQFKKAVEDEGAKVIRPIRGDTLDLGGGVGLSVLWPFNDGFRQPEGSVLGETSFQNVNNSSIVLHLQYGSFDAILTGDAEYPVLEELVDVVPAAEVLKVPHQGAKDSYHRGFIEGVSPDVALISVGENSYGHPNIDVVSYLSSTVGTVLRTDHEGDIEIVTDGSYWEVR